MKLSQEALAELCALHPTYIGQIERGEKNATLESLYHIAQGLGVPLCELLAGLEDALTESSSTAALSAKIRTMPDRKQRLIHSIITDLVELAES